MTLENHESIKTDEGQKEGHSLNKSRRAFTKAGVSVPVVMTLTSKTALGGIYECSISGKLSGNTSNEATSPPSCGVGFSPGGWKENAIKTVNQDGNINHWCLAGVNPFSIRTSSGAPEIRYLGVWKPAVDASRGLKLKTVYDKILAKFGAGAEATKFSSIFGGSAEYVWDVLNANPGSIEFHAIADYLNAKLYQANPSVSDTSVNRPFSDVYSGVHSTDVVNLYKMAKGQITSFTSGYSGVTIGIGFNSAGGGADGFLQSIHH